MKNEVQNKENKKLYQNCIKKKYCFSYLFINYLIYQLLNLSIRSIS